MSDPVKPGDYVLNLSHGILGIVTEESTHRPFVSIRNSIKSVEVHTYYIELIEKDYDENELIDPDEFEPLDLTDYWFYVINDWTKDFKILDEDTILLTGMKK